MIGGVVFVDRSGVENPRGFTKIARTSIIKHFQNFLLKIVAMSLGFFEFRLSIFFEIHENGFSSPYPDSLSDGGGFLPINPRKGTETRHCAQVCPDGQECFLPINPRKGTETILLLGNRLDFCWVSYR